MKGFVVILIILGVWLAYKQHNPIAPLVKSMKPTGYGVADGATSTLSSGFGVTGNFPTSGNNSPGSGVRSVQPSMISSWAYGRNLGSYGSTGPTWRTQ